MPSTIYLGVQFAITVLLLAFAAFIAEQSSQDIIIGAVVGYWLGEGPRMGRLAANGHAKKNGGSPIDTN